MRKLHILVKAYNTVIQEVADRGGVPLIDLYQAFESHGAKRYLTDSCHVDEQGATVLAQTILDAVDLPKLAEARLSLGPH